MLNTNICKELRLKNPPIAVILTETIPDGAVEFDPSVMKGICSLTALKESLSGKAVYLGRLISLFSYESSSVDNVITPMTSGCSSLVKIPLNELRSDKPRAVVGLVDIWARPVFEANAFTITVPYEDYLIMEENSMDCFLQAKTWEGVRNRLE